MGIGATTSADGDPHIKPGVVGDFLLVVCS